MNKFLPFLCIFLAGNLLSHAQDLPTPTANIQSLPTGSYVIAMDNTNQGNGTLMNVKAYGLLVTLLNNNIKLKWVINSAKSKDGNDFSVSAQQIRPTAGTAATFNFKAGPFVVFANDTTGVAALVQTFNTANSTNIKLYRTGADVNVDVRYDLTGFRPKIAVLNDGRNSDIHLGYLSSAAVPTTNYAEEASGANLLTNCYTFASEPHNTAVTTTLISSIKTFVQNGGNFLAQCEAVRSYENSSVGRFQTTGGIGYEKGAGGDNNATVNTSVTFPAANLSYSQFEGTFNMNEGGSVRNWRLTTGSSYINNTHNHAIGTSIPSAVGASVSKLVAASQRGGMVFYLGNHEYDLSDQSNVNGMRMYLNAILTPTPTSGVISYASSISSCGNLETPTNVSVFAQNAPSQAFGIQVQLYTDVNEDNQIDAGDVLLGSTTLTANNTASIISITNPLYKNKTYYLGKATTAPGCYTNSATFRVTNTCGALPVTLMQFNASKQRTGVVLNWQTALEENNEGFEIQRRIGNGAYEKIAFVSSLASNGTGGNTNYSFTDKASLPNGVAYYRLRQIDFDGKSNYSEIRAIRNNSQQIFVTIYPNPARGTTQIVFPEGTGPVDVALDDFSGKTIQRWNGLQVKNLQLSNLKPGLYMIRIIDRSNGEQIAERLLIQ